MLRKIFFEYILIPIAHASSSGFEGLMGRINKHLINPLITVLFALAFVQFILGLFKFFGNKDNSEELETGKRHMLWGSVGMAIMVSVFGIMSFLSTTVGVGNVGNNIRTGGDGDVSGLFDRAQ
jgi:ABC-type phosphate transport system permease subunit